MTIWRQNKVHKNPIAGFDTDDLFVEDPFAMHDDSLNQHLNPMREESSAIGRNTKDAVRRLRSVTIYGIFALAVGLIGFVVAKVKPWTLIGTQELVYAYFEVRAVDQSGRPIAGAVVKNAGKKVGTTDSFGEWRRYMRVPLGSTVPVSLIKSNGKDILYATKNFAVPPAKPEKSDMELRASVQLISGGIEIRSSEPKQKNGDSVANTAIEPKSSELNSDFETTKQRSANSAKSDDTLIGTSTPSTADETNKVSVNAKQVELSATVDKENQAKKFSAPVKTGIQSAFFSSHESVWFEAMGSNTSPLHKEVLPALVARAKELGLKIDPQSTWKVRLTGLVEKPTVLGSDGGGLILLSTFDKASNEAREFLRNYQADARLTARGILFILSHQVDKNIRAANIDGKWFAMLPRNSSQIWKLASGMSLGSAGGRIWNLGTDVHSDQAFAGLNILMHNGSDGPCAGTSECELHLRSFAEVPPVPNWIRIKAKTHGNFKDQVKVFVSGYEARQISDNVIEYWGQDRARVNVTVVHAGKVVQRTQITNDAKYAPTIAWGAGTTSRRY